ncbi:DUF6668 family protein [Aeromicrobium massiliense]|uniref:DUF6668 family protein n=1 Tax=Aeromicrobium massiliense TaxID=1464554 RepID=UPI00067623D2|nr:DUF6668 family protein [Aeromicrobium massiliense]
MTVSDGTEVSPWNVPPMATDPDASTSSHDYRESGATVTAPIPKRPLTGRTTQRPEGIAPFVWVSAHGGAGATSLRRGSGAGLDLTSQWPAPELGWPARVVLVSRANAAGLDAAGRMLQETVSRTVPDVQMVAVVTVADAPTRPSKHIRARLVELGSIAPRVIHMPWVENWRDHPYVRDPAAVAVADLIHGLLKQATP